MTATLLGAFIASIFFGFHNSLRRIMHHCPHTGFYSAEMAAVHYYSGNYYHIRNAIRPRQ